MAQRYTIHHTTEHNILHNVTTHEQYSTTQNSATTQQRPTYHVTRENIISRTVQ